MIDIFIPLLGDHQIENAISAFACIEELKRKGIQISTDAIIKGFKNVKWPGRFEIINKQPLVIVDGAHNSDSFRKLEKTIKKYLSGRKIILIFGASEDKEVVSMLRIIQPHIKTLIITRSEHPRAMELNSIKEIADSLKISSVIEDNVKNAIGEAFVLSDETSVILAAGSIFIAGAVKENIKG